MSKENIIEEQLIENGNDAITLAEDMISEATRMWSSDGWRLEKNKKELLLNQKRLVAVLNNQGS